MKSDVIRKRSCHDARRASFTGAEDTPTTSPCPLSEQRSCIACPRSFPNTCTRLDYATVLRFRRRYFPCHLRAMCVWTYGRSGCLTWYWSCQSCAGRDSRRRRVVSNAFVSLQPLAHFIFCVDCVVFCHVFIPWAIPSSLKIIYCNSWMYKGGSLWCRILDCSICMEDMSGPALIFNISFTSITSDQLVFKKNLANLGRVYARLLPLKSIKAGRVGSTTIETNCGQ